MTCLNAQHGPSVHEEIEECALVRKAAGWLPNEVTSAAAGVTKPVWLLDVDGVLNVDNQGHWPCALKHGTAVHQGTKYPMDWSPCLMRRIKKIIAADVVEIRWATSWCSCVDQLERLWGLPRLSRAFTDDINGYALAITKLTAALSVVNDEKRRLIWTDDVEVPYAFEPTYAELMTAGSLLIRPRETYGLQPKHMNEIEKFLGI